MAAAAATAALTCLDNRTCHVWTGLVLTSTPWTGLVPLALFILFLVNMYMAMNVGAARKVYKVAYPAMYAVPGTPRSYGPAAKAVDGAAQQPTDLCTPEDAYAYNSIQRAHQNSVENYPIVIGLAIIGWGFPIPAGFSLLSWAIGRVFYFNGYAHHHESRNNIASMLLTYPALFTLWGLALCTAVHLYRNILPYNYA